jgi:murein DD-endopeptidase MepM/ murein hydrolase activator NlpD
VKNIYTIKRAAACLAAIVIAMTTVAGTASKSGTEAGILVEKASAEDSAEMKQNKQDISDTKKKLSELEDKQAELDEKISQTKDDISAEEENQAAIEEQISTVQETILTLETSINDLGAQIDELQETISKTEDSIAYKQQQIEEGVADFKQRIRAMYISGAKSYTDILIGASDFYDMLMKIELVKRVAKHDDSMIDNLIDLKKQYEAEEKALEEEKDELTASKEELESQEDEYKEQKAKLEVLFADSQANLDKLAADQEAYENNKDEIAAEEDDFEEQLQALYDEQEEIKKKEEEERKRKEEEERKKAEEEAAKKAAEEAAKKAAESSSSAASTQTSTDNADYNYVTKSQFTWPVPGFYHITYGIGMRWGSYHKGIDIWSSNIRGASITAAASGTVIKVSNTCTHDYGKTSSCGCGGGYGNYCIIDHGNGYWTLYGHSEKITVTQGQTVKQGDVLGTVGSTGYSTGPHLHFEVRLNGVAKDPTDYV